MAEIKPTKVTVLRRIWQSAWFRGLTIAIIAGLITHFAVPCIENIVASPAVEITWPIDGQELEVREVLEGTPISYLVIGTCRKVSGDLHLYMLVHPLLTDVWWVQPMPTIIDGNWQAIVFLGTEEVGGDHLYELCAVITSKVLHEGQTIGLEDFPAYVDRHIITVKRGD